MNLTSSLIVRLLDRVSGPARQVAAGLRGIGTAARAINGMRVTALDRLHAAIARNDARMAGLRASLFDGVAAAYALQRALAAPINAALKLETALAELGAKGNLSAAALRRIGDAARRTGRQVNQFSGDIVKGIDFLVGMGVSVEASEKAMPAIGRAATATGASIEDLAQSGYANMLSLKIAADDLGQAFDIMALAGKEGGFELRDMAAYFPSITAAAAAMGITGVKGLADLSAALQIVRRGAGDGAEAATNFANILQKMNSPLTVKKFGEFGIDLRKELKAGLERGESPIETLLKLTNKALKGDLSKLGDLFQDMQVQKGLRPLLQNFQDYLDMRERVTSARGVIDADFDRMMETHAERIKSFRVALDAMSISVGNALLPALTGVLDAIAPVVDRISELADRFPMLTQAIVGTVSGLIALRVAGAGIGFAFAFLRGGLLRVAAAGLSAVASSLGLIRVALIGSGIGLALVAIGAAGQFIYNNWEGIKAMFSGMVDAFKAGLGPIPAIMQPVADIAGRIFDAISGLTGPLDATTADWRAWGEAIGGAAAAGVNAIVNAIERLLGLLGTAIDKAYALGNAVRSWWSGGAAAAKGMSIPDETGAMPARASGGPVLPGHVYRINEKGQEEFIPGRLGTIRPADARRGTSVSVSMPITINAGGDVDVADLERRVRQAMRDEVRESFRGVLADTGIRFA